MTRDGYLAATFWVPKETRWEQPPSRANIRATDGLGLQPSEMILPDAPGALPQAGLAAGLWPSNHRGDEIPLPPLAEQRRIVSELDAEAAQLDAVRARLPRFAAKIKRVFARVRGNGTEATP